MIDHYLHVWDHAVLLCHLNSVKPQAIVKEISYRKLRSIDIALGDDLVASELRSYELRGENFKACLEQQHVYFCLFCLWFHSMWCKKRFRKSYFHSETKSYSVECLLLLECDRSVIQLDTAWPAHTIYNYANVLFVFVFFCDTSKASENLTFILILSSVCVIIVTRRPIGDSHQDLMRFKNNKRT